MSDKVDTAVRSLKAVGTEISQWENRLEFVKTEVQKNTQTRDALAAEISKKSSDFEIYMAQKDAEVKKSRSDMMAEREQLQKEKNEFMDIMKAHKDDKNALEINKRDLDIQKAKHEASTQNVQEFITAVRRAIGLLGI